MGEPFSARVRRFFGGTTVLPLLLLLGAVLLLVNPVAHFPLNDDWVYGKSVQLSLDQGRIVIHPFSMTFTPLHVAWGALWTVLFGFDYTVLRASTLVLGLAGACFTAWTLRALGIGRGMAIFGGVLVLLNPLYLNLSYTYMTDVPFAVFCAASGLFYVRALSSGRARDVLVATILCAAATLTRQFGVLTVGAYLAAYAFLWWRGHCRPTWRHVAAVVLPWVPVVLYAYLYAHRIGDSSLVIPTDKAASGLIARAETILGDAFLWCASTGVVLLPIVVALVYAAFAARREQGRWMRVALSLVALTAYVGVAAGVLGLGPVLSQGFTIAGAGLVAALRFLFYASLMLLYVGLFLSPLGLARLYAVLTRRERWSRARWWAFLAFAAGVQVLCCGVVMYHLPLMLNMMTDVGVGPRTLVEPYKLHRSWTPVAIGGWWWVFTEVAVLSASVLFCDVIAFVRRMRRTGVNAPEPVPTAQGFFLLVWAAFMLIAPYNPWIPAVYDRYLVQALIPCALAFCFLTRQRPRLSRTAWSVGIAMLVVIAGYSVVCLQDYLAWNRARWEAARMLHDDIHATPDQIDGGYEYNGLYTSDGYLDRVRENGGLDDSSRGWYLVDNRYAISFRHRDGYREIAQVPYFSWLGWQTRTLVVEERIGPAPPPQPHVPAG